MDKSELLKELFKTCTFDEIIDYGLEHNHISGSHILSAAAEYEQKPNDKPLDDALLEIIEEEFDKVCDAGRKEGKPIYYYLPQAYEIMNLIKQYYDDDELIREFDKDDLLDELEGSYELECHDEKIINDYIDENQDPKDSVLYINFKDNVKNYVYEMDYYNFRRFLCDITDLGYYASDDELFSKVIEKSKQPHF